MSACCASSLLDPARHAIQPGDTVVLLSADPAALLPELGEAAGEAGQVIAIAPDAEGCRTAEAAGGGAALVHRARADDLRLDLEAFERWLADNPATTAEGLEAAAARREGLAGEAPLLADGCADVVVADRVLRGLPPERRMAAVAEMYRVVRVAGHVILADVVSDEPLPPRLREEPEFTASLQESELMEALEEARFIGAEILELPEAPTGSAEGIEFRPILVRATKGKEGMCLERLQAVVYLGPWKVVEDDDGHVMRRGQRFAVCNKTYHVYKRPPYAGQFLYLDPAVDIPLAEAKPWDVRHPAERSPAETKGLATATLAAPAATPSDGVGYVIRAEWADRDGAIVRRARVTHRYRGYFETAEEGLEMARTVFEDATRLTPMAVPLSELLERLTRSGRTIACPVPSADPRD